MADPSLILVERVSAALAEAFPTEAGTDPVIRPSANPAFGDYQANVAMALAKRMGLKPRDVADAIVKKLAADDLLAGPAEVAGPGFINLRLADGWLSEQVGHLEGDQRLGIGADAHPQRVVVDYSSPNVAKEMHVGHLRTTIIGDALVRMLEFQGHTVVRQNHLGDWGTPFGMLIEHLIDEGAHSEGGAEHLSVGDLTAFYKAARAKFDSEPGFDDRARNRVVLLQAGDTETLALWRHLVAESTSYFNVVYRELGVLLTDDDLAGESMYNPMLEDTIAELQAKGLAVESDGALCVFPPGFTNRDGDPLPLMLRKRDGGYGYDTTDLAAIRHRIAPERDGGLDAQLLLYCVGTPQAQHFNMIFAAGEQAGWLGGDTGRRGAHINNGSVLGADGKMLKTRAGDTPRLVDMLAEAVDRAAGVVAELSPHLPADEQADVAHKVGIGGVKYADLSTDRASDYRFDLDRMLAREGNTATYLQYAAARCRSIARNAAEQGVTAGPITLTHPAERALALLLLQMDGELRTSLDTFSPHKWCSHLFDLAQAFTTFYEACPVLRADGEATRASRLSLCILVERALTLGLALLGIETPERM